MIENNQNFYKEVIIHTCPAVTDIQTPTFAGSQNNVLFVKSSYEDTVAKFNTRQMVEKNMRVSSIYHAYGIPVPNIRVANYKNQWLEVYPMVHGKTLFQYMQEGMPKEVVRHAYEELVRNFVKMDSIPLHLIKDMEIKTAPQASYQHFKNVNGTLVANMLRPLISLLMAGPARDMGLYHHDISPKNVIVSPTGELKSFLDMDSVAICNRDFALGTMASRWQQQGFNIDELLDMVEETSGRPTGRKRVKAVAAVHSTGMRLNRLKSK